MKIAVIAGALGVLTLVAVAVAGTDEIVIEADRLEPEVMQTSMHGRVTFSNRSGRIVHVEFTGASGEHHVFQVPGSIWAAFHRPGRHPYVIHFLSGETRELHGAVDVVAATETDVTSTCTSVSVLGVCIEP